MTNLFIISIVLFALSGVLFITAIVVFFTTDVMSAIKYLRGENEPDENSVLPPSVTVSTLRMQNKEDLNNRKYVSESANIEYAQQTIDVDKSENSSANNFETMDWMLPDGVSFVLTKNIVLCHSDKEYILREH